MGTITLTNPVAGTVVTAGLHATNYTTIQTVINGNLDTNNWGAGKIFAPSKLMQEGATDKQILQWNNGSTLWGPAGDWAAYTPAWTSSGTAPALGNGTIVGKFVQIGKTVAGRIFLTMGSTTTYGTGNYLFSLPVTANASEVGVSVSVAKGVDTGINEYVGIAAITTTTTLLIQTCASPAAVWTNTVPFTWGNTDTLAVRFVYEAA